MNHKLHKLIYLSLIYISIFLFPHISIARIINVPEEYNTIQEAINMSVDGDTVLVDDGFYPEQVNFNGKNIVVASRYILDQDSTHIYNTEINRSYLNEGVKIISGEGPTAQFVGFTVSNCLWKAVYCKDSSPQIRHNIIDGNAAVGVYLSQSSALISDNTIYGYSGEDLGGPRHALVSSNSGPVIERNVIIEDQNFNVHAMYLTLTNLGYPGISIVIRENLIIGGIFGDFPHNSLPQLIHHNILIPGEEGGSAMNITGCGEGFRVFNNTVVGGYGIWIQFGEHADIRNNLIAYTHTGIESSSDTITVAYNNLWECEQMYNGMPDQTGINGNISANPGLIDPANGNFHFYCWSACIDAGDESAEYSLEPAPNGGRVNIGRYGNTNEAEKSVACIQPFPDAIDFGFVPLLETKDSIIKIINAGHDILLISGVSSSNPVIFSTGYTGGTTAVASHDSLDLLVSFHPVAKTYNYADSIFIQSNAALPGKILVKGQSGLGIESNGITPGLELYPVPVNGEFLFIKFGIPWSASIQVEIVSLSGERVHSEIIHPEPDRELKIGTGSLQAGIYCIRIISDSNNYAKKFIKIR
jgi:hypothetical protein